jgi:integrase/recombinase XerD
MITFYDKSPEEYVGFLTPEATAALNEYFEERKRRGEIFHDETPVFRTTYAIGSSKARPMPTGTIKAFVYRLVTESVERVKTGKRYNIQTDHGFRKRFNSILKESDNVNISLAEKLMSHSTRTVQLDTVYHAPTPERLFAEFKKHIKNLTINDAERQKVELEQNRQKLGELEFYKEKLAEMDKKYRDLISRPVDDLILLEKIRKWKDRGLI